MGIRLYQAQHELEVVLAEQMPPLRDLCAHGTSHGWAQTNHETSHCTF